MTHRERLLTVVRDAQRVNDEYKGMFENYHEQHELRTDCGACKYDP